MVRELDGIRCAKCGQYVAWVTAPALITLVPSCPDCTERETGKRPTVVYTAYGSAIRLDEHVMGDCDE